MTDTITPTMIPPGLKDPASGVSAISSKTTCKHRNKNIHYSEFFKLYHVWILPRVMNVTSLLSVSLLSLYSFILTTLTL